MPDYSLLNPVTSALFVVRDDRILFANAAALRLTGYNAEAVQALGFTDLLLPEHREEILTWQQSDTAPAKIQLPLRTATGEIHVVELSAEAVETEAAWLITAIDLTRYRNREQPVRRQEKLSRAFQDLLKTLQSVSLRLAEAEGPDALYRQSIELGRSELLFDRLGLWLVSDDPEYVQGTFGTDETGQIRDERGIRLPQSIMHRDSFERVRFFDNQILVYISHNIPLLDHRQETIGEGWIIVAFLTDGGEITGYLCADNLLSQRPMAAYQPELLALYASTLTHLIRRKRTEAELQEAKLRYAELVDNIPGMVYRTRTFPDGTQQFDYLSPRCLEFTGVPQEEALRDMSLLLSQIHPDDLADYRRTADESAQSRSRFLWDGRFIVNNHIKWCRVESHPRYLPDGTVLWDGIVTDITAQRQAEESIRQSEARALTFQDRLKLLASISIRLAGVESVDELCRQAVLMCYHDLKFDRAGLWLIEEDDRYIRGTFGVDESGQLRDERHMRLLRQPSPEEQAYLERQIAKLKSGDSHSIEVYIRETAALQNNQGEPVGSGWLIMATLTDGEKIIGFLYIDNFFNQHPLAQHEPELLGLYASTLSNLYIRKQIEQALRQSEERYRMLAEYTSDIVALIQPDGTFSYVSPSLERTLGYSHAELNQPAQPDGTYADDFSRAIETLIDLRSLKETVRFEYRVRHRSGDYLWLESYASPILATDGQVMQVLVSSRDITERRQMQTLRFEQEKLRVALDKERELSDLKTHMMERISHEFRTPLTIIGTASDLLERYYERLTPEQRQARLEQIKKQIKQISTMLENIGLLTYSRFTRMPLDIQALNAEKLCQEVIAQLQTELSRPRRIVFTAGAGIQQITADRQVLWHILYQLLSNAVKYSPENRAVWLTVSREHETLVIVVRDEGMGISAEDQKRMFEPFYRSRRMDERPGLGLGLSIVREALDAHYGTLTVDSEPDKGATFTVRLPALPFNESNKTGPVLARGD